MVGCSGGYQANLDWLRESFGAAADGFMIRGTPYVTGSVLRLLLDAGVRPAGDPSRAHMVVVDARGPKFDGGIVTRITAIPHGIVVDRDGRRFHDEGEDARKTHYARWGARIADCPGQIAYLIMDAKGLDRALPTALPPIRAGSIPALAAALGLDPAALETTMRDQGPARPRGPEWSRHDHGGECAGRRLSRWPRRRAFHRVRAPRRRGGCAASRKMISGGEARGKRRCLPTPMRSSRQHAAGDLEPPPPGFVAWKSNPTAP